MTTKSPTDMLLQLEDIADSHLHGEDRALVRTLIECAHSGQVTPISDEQLATLQHIHRQHFV
jgi:hypothetical protein